MRNMKRFRTAPAPVEMTAYKGFTVGQAYVSLFDLTDEYGETVPKGTALRIVAIAPKVRMQPVDETHDGLPFFFNAVKDTEIDYWERYALHEKGQTTDKPLGNRIRANFKTLQKTKMAKKVETINEKLDRLNPAVCSVCKTPVKRTGHAAHVRPGCGPFFFA